MHFEIGGIEQQTQEISSLKNQTNLAQWVSIGLRIQPIPYRIFLFISKTV